MSAPRASDDPATAALRAVLRDPVLMARVITTVEEWRPLTEDQRATISALFTRPRTPTKNPAEKPAEKASRKRRG